MRSILKKIGQKIGGGDSGSAKNVLTLMSGTMLSTILPILFSPIMTRIFSPEHYGILGVYISISGVLGVLAYAHYSQAVLLAKDEVSAKSAVQLTLSISTAFSIFIWLLIFFYKLFGEFSFIETINVWLYLIPVSILLNGFNATLLVWANRTKAYKVMAKNRIWQALATICVQLVFGFLFKNETGLLLGLLTGQLLSVLLLLKKFGFVFKDWLSNWSAQLKIFKEFKNLLFYSTPSEFINNVINQTPIFLLKELGNISFVGSYNFTNRLLGIPQQFFSSAVIEVFKQKASEDYHNNGNCRGIFIKTFKILLALAVIPFLGLAILSPYVFEIVFGPKWVEAGIFAQYLSLLFLFRFSISPLTYVYYIAGKQREDFLLHILFLIVTTASFFLGDFLFSDKRLMILCYSISYSSIYILYFIRSYQFSGGVNKTVGI